MQNTNQTTIKIIAPPLGSKSPSITESPVLLENNNNNIMVLKSPKNPLNSITSRVSTPISSPMKKAVASMQYYLEEVGNFTRLHPQEAWLPITESRNGNYLYAAFHSLSSGLGAQALVLPLAFATLGWTWGVLGLTLIFMWQLNTLWLLIQLHEAVPGMRHSRYLGLSMAAFGEKAGKGLALFPTMYLSGGTCVTLIIIGSDSIKIFCQIISQNTNFSTLECYFLFILVAIILSQLPNLNSLAGISLIGAITAVSYCTFIWVVSVSHRRPNGVSYDTSDASIFSVFNAIGIIAFAFRGHNLVLEIQGTMPSSSKQPSRVPMWTGVKFAYLAIAMCLFPLAIGGYWAYGNLIQGNGGMLNAMYKYHKRDASNVLLAITSLLITINSVSSFQIYAMPAFDNLELRYTSKMNKPCPWWLRSGLRVFFGCLTLFVSITVPFLPSLAGLIGGVALPITLAYPCLMWIFIEKPNKYSLLWCINWVLGILGVLLSVSVIIGAIWSIVTQGIDIHFFKPQ